jgi:hypothetical protein
MATKCACRGIQQGKKVRNWSLFRAPGFLQAFFWPNFKATLSMPIFIDFF